MPTELLSATEAAALLQVSDETVRRWADAGKIRHVRLPSGQLRIYRQDVEAILTPVEPTPPKAVGE
jgi:excisionase family DNA binding protein